MDILELYKFEKDQPVPEWLYTIHNAGETVPCTFGTVGYCALLSDSNVIVWPSVDRLPDEYVFVTEQTYLANATAGHPAGDALLRVMGNEALALELLGIAIDGINTPLPDLDPRDA